jgi:L-iditol 2-dehydrogenase
MDPAATTMRALMLVAERRLEVVDLPIPDLERRDDVLVKVRAVGVCGSDLHGYLGHTGRRIPPLVMGHEAAGEVVAVGPEVRHLTDGSRVATNTVAACGRCRPCTEGIRSLCEERRILGMSAQGAYAEYVVWPEDSLVELPANLPFEVGALAEPLAITLHAIGLASLRPGDSVFITGAGAIGLLLLALVRLCGAGRVIVSDLYDDRLEIARRLGADIVVNAASTDPVSIVLAETAGAGVDVAFEAVGAGETARQTISAVRNGGSVIWVGINADMVEVSMQTIVTRSLRVLGAYGMTADELERSLDLLARARIPSELIIGRQATLEEAPALFEELLSSHGTVKGVIVL